MICLMAMHYQNAKSCPHQILPQSPADHAISWDRTSQVADSTTGEKMSPHRQDSEPTASRQPSAALPARPDEWRALRLARAARKAFLPASPGDCRDRRIGSHAGPQRRGHRPAACSLAGDARSARPGPDYEACRLMLHALEISRANLKNFAAERRDHARSSSTQPAAKENREEPRRRRQTRIWIN